MSVAPTLLLPLPAVIAEPMECQTRHLVTRVSFRSRHHSLPQRLAIIASVLNQLRLPEDISIVQRCQ